MDCPRAVFHLGVTQEWVDEGRLPKERTKSKVEETLRCIGRGHTAEGSQFEFIPQGSECNGDVTRRRHGAADRGGTVCGNAIHTILPHEGLDHTEV